MRALVCLTLLTCFASLVHAAISPRNRALQNGEVANISEDLISRCEKRWFTTNLDHFSRSVGPNDEDTFQLRYYVCDGAHRHATEDEPAGPIFFYLGNEADVLLYLNATGLMWENAEEFGAMLVFAEHRYYGESLPFGADTFKHMQWLSTEQALADYASLIYSLQTEKNLDVPVIGFGGSYGGMLGAWGRLKYPHAWHGVIAGSAPIWAFEGEHPPIDPNYFAKGVTYDTTEAAGAAPGCTATLRSAWAALISLAEGSDGGLADASDALNICPHRRLNTTADAYSARGWAASAFDMMAMGNYPFESGYMLNGQGLLPAFPVRVACKALMDTYTAERTADPLTPVAPASSLGAPQEGRRQLLAQPDEPHRAGSAAEAFEGVRRDSAQEVAADVGGDAVADTAQEVALVKGLAAAIAVWYNYTGDVMCYDPWKGVNEETQHIASMWDYQWCTEMWMPNGRDGVTDVFWSEPWDPEASARWCESVWGVQPRRLRATVEWGGRRLEALSNVVFSNGLYDPWHGGGVLEDLSDTVKAVIIPNGAHHLDLMFSHENDPDTVKEARLEELANIRSWIADFHAQRAAA